jgi:hypothetical protein
MENVLYDFSVRNALTLVTLFMSAMAIIVVYSQMKIASTKLRLDLYNKRFAIYQSAFDLYNAHNLHNWNPEVVSDLELQFLKSFRESQFLFDEKHGIYKILETIKKNSTSITIYKKHMIDPDRASKDKSFEDNLHKNSNMAFSAFHNNLLRLEDKISNYIYFGNIDGWNWLPTKKQFLHKFAFFRSKVKNHFKPEDKLDN